MDLNKLKFWQSKAASPLDEQWSHTYDVTLLRARLAALDAADPLYPLLLGFLDAQIVAQADGRVTPETAAMVVGRMNMCADVKSDLRKLWRDAHTARKE